MDIRGVDGLMLNQIVFESRRTDEREPYLVEESRCLKEDVYIEGENTHSMR